jgi:beta-lactamase class A
MGRIHSVGRGNASLPRRQLLAGLGGLGLAGCGQSAPLTAATTPGLDMAGLQTAVAAIAQRAAPGVLGVGLMNLDSGEFWTTNGDRPFPMQSVFKAPLGAALLAEVDARRVSLDEIITLEDTDLSPPHSPVAELWPSRRDYSLGELLDLTVSESDNTAADLLLRKVGGPGALTAWLQSKDVDEVRVDRYEREMQPQSAGLISFRPSWKGEAYSAAVASVAPAQRRAALARYMADPRDTATPRGMLSFLQRLDAGQLVSQASTRRLLTLMTQTPRGAGRIKAGLPAGASLAHKPGTGRTEQGISSAHNDVGIFTLADKRSYALAVFLSGSTLNAEGRDQVIADVARAAVRAVR